MTVASTASRWSYTGNGVTTAFGYSNRIFAASDLKVYLAGALQTLSTHYSVSGVDQPAGGSVTFVTAPAVGASVVIVRDVPATQPTDYQPNDPFPAETHEAALDRLTVLVQQLLAQLGRALQLADSDAAASIGRLPNAATRAGQVLAFDSTGAPIAAAPSTTALLVSAFMQTLLDAADAAVARATLGAAGTGVGNTFTADQTIRSDDASNLAGPALDLYRNSASPVGNDAIGRCVFKANNASATAFTAAAIEGVVLDPTAGSEDGAINISTAVAGTKATRLQVGQGAAVGVATDPGVGKLNAQNGFQVDGNALPFQRRFVSAEQAITLAGALTLAHGLPAKPDFYEAFLVCKSAELGFSVNDETPLVNGFASNQASAVRADGTNVTVRFASGGIGVARADTGVAATITPASWRLVVRAWT